VGVDLHQWVRADADEPTLVLEHLAASPLLPIGNTRDRLLSWLSAWSKESSPLRATFSIPFFEYDLAGDDAQTRLSGFFVDVHARSGKRDERVAREQLILATVEQLCCGITGSRLEAFEKCLKVVEERGSIGHLGFMLAHFGERDR
jgi:hypothetical protein